MLRQKFFFENHGHINFDTDKAYYFRHRTLHEKLIDLYSKELPKLQHMFAAILFYDSVTLKMGSRRRLDEQSSYLSSLQKQSVLLLAFRVL